MAHRQIDVLAVGDVVTDAFINLFEDRGRTYENEEGKWLALPFGTKMPFEFFEIVEGVGNAANAAVACSRLGLRTGFVTNVGDDQYGREIIASLGRNFVDTHLVRINPGKQSNYHFVLWYSDERTILIKHEEYEYHWPQLRTNEVPAWIYFSSLAKSGLGEFTDELMRFLQENPETKLAFQPGTYQLEAGMDVIGPVYARTDVVVMNREEAQSVTGGDWNNIHDLIDKMHGLGPRVVCVTDGPNGAYASDGEKRLKMPIYPDPKPPYERTGAGDAFASTFIAYIMKGYDVEGALQHAPINSMSVVQQTGAQKGLLTEKEIEELLAQAPDWYHPSEF